MIDVFKGFRAHRGPARRPAPPRDEPAAEPARPGRAEAGAARPDGEQGGPEGPEPTRFGDWERNGRCIDF